MPKKLKNSLSDIIGFLILFIIIIAVVIPILLYVTYSYSNNLVPENLPQPSLGTINVTYVIQQGNEILKIQYTSGTDKPTVLNIYNYSVKGIWMQASYTPITANTNSEEFEINGPSNTLLVELLYLNQIFYVQVGLNSSVLVG
ncbi:hypothetical protein [Saccharolobus shibatae]|uniref:Uncharacterized protein n=1 Tax=Saccharolobus shibatae TaxID=2286 RepID=A0A8F5GY79_9CREN|nr:hypothetical protein [Saccharolobus shibatae]QXJ33825.1 hypothetical protein J5U22_00370 [Saccharolobus shibatae]